VPVLALSVLLAACGGSSKTATGSSTTTAPSGSASASFAKYTACLESHGVPASAASSLLGGGRGPGASSASGSGGSSGSAAAGSTTRPTISSQYQSAFGACRSDLPTGGFAGGGGFNSAASAAYRNCLTLHGVTIPSTPPTTAAGSSGQGGGSGGAFSALRNNPKFQAAEKACASLLPARPGASATTTVPPAS
jgi:hypothetical protein